MRLEHFTHFRSRDRREAVGSRMIAMAYSLEFRRQVMAAVDEGRGTQTEIARMFGVTDRWIRKLMALRRLTGSLELSRARRGPRGKISGRLQTKFTRLVARKPDATLAQFRDRLGVDASLTTIWRALRRLEVTFKKKV